MKNCLKLLYTNLFVYCSSDKVLLKVLNDIKFKKIIK